MVKIWSASVFLILTLALANALAWEPTHGAEFEVTKENLFAFDSRQDNPSQSNVKEAQLEFVNKMRERCLISKCTVTEIDGKWDKDYLIKYPDGWWFKVSYDPACVEFTFLPSTVAVLEKKAALINDQIFGTAKQVGLEVQFGDTSHYNLGVRSAFGDDVNLFLRFFVDYANHADLALGSLGEDLENGPPLSILQGLQRKALQEIVRHANKNRYRSIEEVAQAIQKTVYTHSYDQTWGSAFHYQAIGLKYVARANLKEKDMPLEIRPVWIQDSAEKFILIAKLIEGRIRYLRKQTGPIIYSGISRTEFNPSELNTRFAIYVEEAGLRYEDYKELLPEWVQKTRLNSFARTDAPIKDRLRSLPYYWDLIPISEWARQRVVEILTDPQIQDLPLTKKMRQKIQVEATKDKAASFSPAHSDFFASEPGESQKNSDVMQIFKSLAQEIESKNQSNHTNFFTKVLFTRELVRNASRCLRVFSQ